MGKVQGCCRAPGSFDFAEELGRTARYRFLRLAAGAVPVPVEAVHVYAGAPGL